MLSWYMDEFGKSTEFRKYVICNTKQGVYINKNKIWKYAMVVYKFIIYPTIYIITKTRNKTNP